MCVCVHEQARMHAPTPACAQVHPFECTLADEQSLLPPSPGWRALSRSQGQARSHTHLHACSHTIKRTCAHTHAHAHVLTHMHTHVNTHIHTSTHAMHTHKHMHTHTYSHTCTRMHTRTHMRAGPHLWCEPPSHALHGPAARPGGAAGGHVPPLVHPRQQAGDGVLRRARRLCGGSHARKGRGQGAWCRWPQSVSVCVCARVCVRACECLGVNVWAYVDGLGGCLL